MTLRLYERKNGVLVASLPVAYRAVMAGILAVVCLALASGGSMPGPIGWIALLAASSAALYEDRWIIDSPNRKVTHRSGLVFLSRSTVIAKDDIVGIRVAPFVRGTSPGTADEAAENAAALAGDITNRTVGRSYSLFKRRYLCILIETADGSGYFVDAGLSARGSAIKKRAERIAAACGVPLSEG